MLDWKLQDKIKLALETAAGNLETAAKALNMKPEALQRKMKKWGMNLPHGAV
jgi:transcriptional regulator with GAF, ATPase, and Fis domain